MKRLPLAPLLPALALACGGVDPAAGPRLDPGTPIVVVSIDTLRSDRLPAYGYTGGATPAIDRLRRDSILFEHAYTPIPLTLPAHTTLFSGKLPPEHGIRDNMGYRLRAGSMPWLPAILGERGYATGAAISTFVLRSNTGFAEGFDFFEDRMQPGGRVAERETLQRRGIDTLAASRDWLRSVADRPFFFFFHLYDPHTPYDPPEPFASRYDSPYDGEVAESDRVVGLLLHELRDLGIYDRSLVVLLSDHGEGLGDHGYREHGALLYREALQVPLLVKLPGSVRGGETVAAAAHLVDFAPTLLGLLGEPVPAELPGTSWLALDDAAPPRPLLAETHYPRIHYGWSELASVIEFPLHFIYGPDPELYDLAADPAETVNLVSRRRDDARRLKAALDRWDRTLAPAAEVDPETRRRLAALGYVGSGPAETEGPLPDPKTRVASMEQVREAAAALQAGRLPEAETELRRLLEREPGMADAWQQLGHTLMQQGRPQQAWEAYRQAVELSNGAPQIALSAATALLAVGRLEDARAHAMLAVTAVDDAWDLLAQVALREGKLAEAEGHVERALATRGGRVGPLLSAAELRLRQGRYEEAVELAEEAEREHPPPAPQAELRGLGLVRGGALARLGEAERAEEAFRREIERSPDLLASYAELAFLLGLLDRAPEAGATLRRMVETNPTPRAYAVAVETLNRLGDVASARRVLQAARDRWPGDSELRQLEASGPAP